VRRESRSEDDGFRSELVPGLHASADAERLAAEVAFAQGVLAALALAPVGRYAEARELAGTDIEAATLTCFQIAAAPRTPLEIDRSAESEAAYLAWVERSGGSQAEAFRGESSWTPERRFERLFERLALPGFPRAPRYHLLVTLGRLGLYELRAGSLQLAGAPAAGDDATTLAAKRIFAIGDPLLLERRAGALAAAADVPIDALDLALANWGSAERITLGFPGEVGDEGALARTREALGL
jgi:hypothetical protein